MCARNNIVLKLIGMISGNIEFEDIRVNEYVYKCGFKEYCLTIYKEHMKEWMKFIISHADFRDDDGIAQIGIQLCERLNRTGKAAVRKCRSINISSIIEKGKFEIVK